MLRPPPAPRMASLVDSSRATPLRSEAGSVITSSPPALTQVWRRERSTSLSWSTSTKAAPLAVAGSAGPGPPAGRCWEGPPPRYTAPLPPACLRPPGAPLGSPRRSRLLGVLVFGRPAPPVPVPDGPEQLAAPAELDRRGREVPLHHS